MLTQLKLPCYRPSVSPTCSAYGAVGGGNVLRTQPQRLQQQWSVAWPTAGIDEAGRGLLMQLARAFRAGLVICIMQGLASACLICILWAIAAMPFFLCRRFVASVEYVCTYIHRAKRQRHRGWGMEIAHLWERLWSRNTKHIIWVPCIAGSSSYRSFKMGTHKLSQY